MKLRSGISPSMVPSANPRMDALRKKVRAMPQEPGIYRWFNDAGEIIYVGKAKNLRQRLRSYVTPTPRIEHFRKRALIETMADLDVTFCSTEMEALILEMHLIRTLKPRYNVSLTRDRHYVYIRIGNGPFPNITIVNHVLTDGAQYIGPYTNPWTQYRTLELLRSLYKFRTCAMDMNLKEQTLFEQPSLTIPLELTFKNKDRRTPCLDYHIKKCAGPCTGDMLPEDYQKACIEPVVNFYSNKTSAVLEQLIARMRGATGDTKFERAQEVHDMLSYLDQMTQQKKQFDIHAKRIDAFGFTHNLDSGTVLQVRGGNLANEERLILEGEKRDATSSLTPIIMQFYAGSEDIPDVVAIPHVPDDLPLLNEWLTKEAKHTVNIRIPKRGELHRLVKLAQVNAERKTEANTEVSVHS